MISSGNYAQKNRGHIWNILVFFILGILTIWLFRGHFLGDSIWIGNSDRLNSEIKLSLHYFSQNIFSPADSWDEFEMLGFDSMAMPYSFPSPIHQLISSFGYQNLIVASGYVNILLLFCSGIASYFFLQSTLGAPLAALIGSICYEFSYLSLLKNSQNNLSFSVIIFIPIVSLLIIKSTKKNAPIILVALTFLLNCMINFMFLQKVAYAFIFFGILAIFQAKKNKNLYPIIIFGICVAISLIYSSPRIITIITALSQYSRVIGENVFASFESIYQFQGIYPVEILRWFDPEIFGKNQLQAYLWGNRINLSEGFLLFSSPLILPLIAYSYLYTKPIWRHSKFKIASYEVFFFWLLVGTVLFAMLKPLQEIVYYAFGKMDFTHSRILIVGLLAQSAVLVAALRILEQKNTNQKVKLFDYIFATFLALSICIGVELLSLYLQRKFGEDYLSLPDIISFKISFVSISRIALSYALFILAMMLLAKLKKFANLIYLTIAISIGIQSLILANVQINHIFGYDQNKIFDRGSYYFSNKFDFQLPTSEQKQILANELETPLYRAAIMCGPEAGDGFCAGHIPEFWQIRTVVGYYGLGVPIRMRFLPWPPNMVSLRSINIPKNYEIPWDLLGFLNVKYGLISNNALFLNRTQESNSLLDSIDIVKSPARVTPRAFFAKNIAPVNTAKDAVDEIFLPSGITDPTITSYVEGAISSSSNLETGDIEISGKHDSLNIKFLPVSTERLLILNELYYPGWHAITNSGIELPILPANVVMRAVVVPKEVTSIQFQYKNFARSMYAKILHIISFALLVIFFFIFKKNNRNDNKNISS